MELGSGARQAPVLSSRPGELLRPGPGAPAPFHMVPGGRLTHPAAQKPCGGVGLGEPPETPVRVRGAPPGKEVPEETPAKGWDVGGTRLTSFGLCPSWPWSFSFGPGARALRERGMDEGPMWEGGGERRENAGPQGLAAAGRARGRLPGLHGGCRARRARRGSGRP